MTYTKISLALFIGSMFVKNTAMAHEHQKSIYAGEETRSIKSLSAKDIDELERGGGWGLAKAAELNGMPGPAHLLELKTEIALTDQQVRRITNLYDSMKTEAIRLGTLLIDHERTLEKLFRTGSVTPVSLRAALQDTSDARMQLRYTHLVTHLKSPRILSKAQINTYNQLRGYSKATPCQQAPNGHDVNMWRNHNGCN